MPRKSLWIGLLLTAAFLVLAFRGIDPAGVAAALARADYWYVLPALAIWALGYLVRTARWRVILSAEAAMPFSRLLSVLVIGFASNNVLPARLGEFVRATLLQRSGRVRFTFALATIFLERIWDGLALILILFLIGLFNLVPDRAGVLDGVELVAAPVFLGLSLFIALTLWRAALAERIVALVSRPAPHRIRERILSLFRGFIGGLATMREPRRLGATVLLSLATWTLEGLAYFALTWAFDLQLEPLTRLVLAFTVLVMVNLSIMIPSAPGYVGTFDAAGGIALRLFGVPGEMALAYTIVAHALQYLLVTLAGLAFVAREGVSFAALGARPALAVVTVADDEGARA